MSQPKHVQVVWISACILGNDICPAERRVGSQQTAKAPGDLVRHPNALDEVTLDFRQKLLRDKYVVFLQAQFE